MTLMGKWCAMAEDNYLRWPVNETATTWRHGSGDLDEFRPGPAHGATGVTTKPVLVSAARDGPEGPSSFEV